MNISSKAAKERARKAQQTIREKSVHPCSCALCIADRYRFSYAGASYVLSQIARSRDIGEIEKEVEQMFRKEKPDPRTDGKTLTEIKKKCR